MKSTDARNLTHNQLTDLRHRAVRAVQDGENPEDVARVLGVSRTTVYGWLALYRQGGWGALDARKRGGRKPKLNADGLAWVYRTVTQGNPRQFKFRFALWSSSMLGQLIHEHLGIRLSKASVCRLLHQLGLTPQRPLWRAYQQDAGKVTHWLTTEFPRIEAEARKHHATIWFGDEAGVRSDAHAGTTWAPKGKTPVITTTGARFGLNLISAVTRRGDLRFMGVRGRVNAAVFIEFLQRLIDGEERPVFLVVDGHPVHKANRVQKFVASTQGRLRLYFLPPYSPELNPDEQVWNDLKNNGLGRIALSGPDELHREAISHLRFLQKSPHLIRSFFQMSSTRYAA